MPESIKTLLGLKNDVNVKELTGAKIFKAAMKKGLLKKKVIIEFKGKAIDEGGKADIIRMLVEEVNTSAIKNFLIILDEEIKQSSEPIKKKHVTPKNTKSMKAIKQDALGKKTKADGAKKTGNK